ncbi:YwbE family protein [Carboxylicivirga linearis]|nr:YwbE family protein [Carboxylicivirga linearis]
MKNKEMTGKERRNISAGLEVDIVLKKDQRTGELTRGIVKDILTKSAFHPHGIKVRLEDGQVGRVQEIIED